MTATSVFLSYSWDGDQHQNWVRALAERLRADGVEADLDQWAAVPGDQLPQFMEQAIAQHEFVLIVCTPRYKAKSEAREGGVGYEGDIITGELLRLRNHRKFIPVLRLGDWSSSAPGWLAGKYYIDLRDGEGYETQYEESPEHLDWHSTNGAGSRGAPPPGSFARAGIGLDLPDRRAGTNRWRDRGRGD